MREAGPISVVVPARDEADRIAHTIQTAGALPGVDEVIVVDDGSADDTAEVARAAGATVAIHPTNRGKAAAMETGACAARGSLLLFLDADLGATAAEARVLTQPVLRGDADLAIATFPVVPGRGGGRGIVVRVSRWGIRRCTGREMIAPLSGQRCLTRDAFSAVRPLAPGFGVETAMTIDALRAGLRVIEVPTAMDHRVTQNDWRARMHRLRQLRDVGKALLPRLLGRRPR